MWKFFKGPVLFGKGECRLVYRAKRDPSKNYLAIPIFNNYDKKKFETTEYNEENKKRIVITSITTCLVIETTITLAEKNEIIIYCRSFDKNIFYGKTLQALFLLSKEIIDDIVRRLDLRIDSSLSAIVLNSPFGILNSDIYRSRKNESFQQEQSIAGTYIFVGGSAFISFFMGNSSFQKPNFSMIDSFVKVLYNILDIMSAHEFGVKVKEYDWFTSEDDKEYYCVKEARDKTIIFALTLGEPDEFFSKERFKDCFNF